MHIFVRPLRLNSLYICVVFRLFIFIYHNMFDLVYLYVFNRMNSVKHTIQTLICLFPSVHIHMVFKLNLFNECFTTITTYKWFLTGVYLQMSLNIRLSTKCTIITDYFMLYLENKTFSLFHVACSSIPLSIYYNEFCESNQ